jgi:hypothetical protein
MVFDPIAWGCGFVLNQLSARLLKPLSSDELRKQIGAEASEWAKALPPEVAVDYQYIFGETTAEPDPQTRPARFQLQEVLQAGFVPSRSQWVDAFVEHWEAKSAELGAEGNAFFQQPKEAAYKHLLKLAGRIHRCCQADPALARRTILEQLGDVLRGQQEERQHRHLPYYVRELTPAARQLFLDRPAAWEYTLFSTVLADEIAQHASLLRDYAGGLSWGPRIALDDATEISGWIKTHLAEGQQFGTNLSMLVNEQLPVAFGPPGLPGDAQAIIDIARKLADGHRQGIEWALTVRRVSAPPDFHRLLRLTERLVVNMISEIREFSGTLASSLKAALSDQSRGPKRLELTLTLTVPAGLQDQLEAELEALAARLVFRIGQ